MRHGNNRKAANIVETTYYVTFWYRIVNMPVLVHFSRSSPVHKGVSLVLSVDCVVEELENLPSNKTGTPETWGQRQTSTHEG